MLRNYIMNVNLYLSHNLVPAWPYRAPDWLGVRVTLALDSRVTTQVREENLKQPHIYDGVTWLAHSRGIITYNSYDAKSVRINPEVRITKVLATSG